MLQEIRQMLLYGQMQEGVHHEMLKISAVAEAV